MSMQEVATIKVLLRLLVTWVSRRFCSCFLRMGLAWFPNCFIPITGRIIIQCITLILVVSIGDFDPGWRPQRTLPLTDLGSFLGMYTNESLTELCMIFRRAYMSHSTCDGLGPTFDDWWFDRILLQYRHTSPKRPYLILSWSKEGTMQDQTYFTL